MYLEAGLAGACVLGVYFALFVHIRIVKFSLDQAFLDLDANLAQAIKKLLEELPIGDIDPPNPMQMMIMQILQDNLARNPAKVMPRDEKGLFTGKDPE